MIPDITPEQMEEIVRRSLPGARIEVQRFNPEYRSWRMRVWTSCGELELVWGPLTGFGVSDFRVKNENPFAPFDYKFESLEEAEAFLKNFRD